MHSLNTIDAFNHFVQQHPACLLLFGGVDCGVCQTLKPRIEQLCTEHYPQLNTAYIDCQQDGRALCAQQSVFSLPVVEWWFGGQCGGRLARSFALGELKAEIERPYRLLFA